MTGIEFTASGHPEDAPPAEMEDELLDRGQASAYLATLGVRRKRQTLAKLHACSNDGPVCVHRGRKPLYPKRALHAWGMVQLSARRRSPTSRRTPQDVVVQP